MKIEKWTDDVALWIMYMAFFWTGYLSGTQRDWIFDLILFIVIIPFSIYARQRDR